MIGVGPPLVCFLVLCKEIRPVDGLAPAAVTECGSVGVVVSFVYELQNNVVNKSLTPLQRNGVK